MDAAAPRHARDPLWDVFCRVIDNRGDAGVCWRLARNLALRDQRVRLWIDDPAALDGMADDADRALVAAGRIAVHPWDDALDGAFRRGVHAVGERVVEAFGCEPPEAVVAAMAAAATSGAAVPWINLEYLSAEPYVERSHGLPSPILAGPGRGLTRWFFFPGFTARTGGLLREPGPGGAFDPGPPSALPAVSPSRPLVITLFHYAQPHLDRWIDEVNARLAPRPVRWIAAGAPHAAGHATPDAPDERGVCRLPWLPQSGYDRLLATADLNVVRGEDSAVRGQWAGRPFLWHLYPQADGAHAVKLQAFMDRFLASTVGGAAGAWPPATDPLADDLRLVMACWNGVAPPDAFAPALARLLADGGSAWEARVCRWRDVLRAQDDLATQLIRFAAEIQARSGGQATNSPRIE